MSVRRRDLFRFGGLGGALSLSGAAGWSVGRVLDAKDRPAAALPALDVDCTGAAAADAPVSASAGYAAKFLPAAYYAGERDNLHTPPARAPFSAELREFDLSVVETTLEVAGGQNVKVWAYGGTVPGPIIRATVGEQMQIALTNRSETAHSVHFHGAHDVMQDGLVRVGGGGHQTYRFEAGPVGLHPYHCHVPPYARHMRKGMYGAMIVDPREPRPSAHEFVLCLCGFDTDGDGRNDVYTWNGMAGYYERFPLKVPVGELVRIYLMNMLEYDPVASFHLHAQTFDLYRSGTSLIPHEHTDIVGLGPAERAVIEFRLPRRGRYMFHPHQSHMAERGAMGWIVAI
jgi:FtsP/CotA-like multicopper oxidase with cupredoxin domain